MRKTTLRLQLIGGFLVLILTLALFLFYENYYAMKVVREEVAQSTGKALSIHIAQVDRTLEDVSLYLQRLTISGDSIPDYIALSQYPQENGEYVYAKIRIQADLVAASGGFDRIRCLFAYADAYGDFVFSDSSYISNEKLRGLLVRYWDGLQSVETGRWQVLRDGDEPYLLRTERVVSDADVYAGAIIRLSDLLESLREIDYGERWDAILLHAGGDTTTDASLSPDTIAAVNRLLQAGPPVSETFENPADGNRYLLVSLPFRQAPLSLAAMIAEDDLLQRLPFFQRVIVLIPVGVAVLVYFYLLLLRKVLLDPMQALIKGMRQVMRGELEIRVRETRTVELDFLIQTFNRMVEQTRHLKINVYEEMLKAQQAEFKHLQAQINPHFYLNCLNLIYSLAILGENGLIRRMTELLSDYFRFIARSRRDTVTIEEEVRHIRNYLDIQSLRFPGMLTYAIDVEEACGGMTIFPLMIQPFVENAIIHGMEEGALFHVELTVALCRDDPGILEIIVRDNGKGFTDEALAAFNRCEFGDGTGAHLGVWNVYRRLGMAYGERAKLSFGHRSPKGAEVRLAVPVPTGDNDLEAERDG